MPRGGSRPGAGRKPKTKPQDAPAAKPVVDAAGFKTEEAPENWTFGKEPPKESESPVDLSKQTPLDFLLQVMRDPQEDKGRRMQAASLAAPYCHPKKGESTKKAEAEEKARAAGAGRFATRKGPPGPQLAAAGGKRV
jgi:phage terminase small subunit